jgi:hypothetical protein
MAAPLILRNLFWALTTLFEVGLLVVLFRRRLYRSHPAFCFYILVAILQSAVVAFTYGYFGASSRPSYFIAWGSQGVVICTRWIAVVEIAKNALGHYAGIWAMADRIMLVLSVFVLGYSVVSSGSRGTLVILTADRSLELCIATFIVGMFFFVRYYRVPVPPLERFLAIGFCLYSCFLVINDSMYEHWRRAIAPMWSYLDMLTFLASLLLWIRAVSQYSEAPQLTTQTAVSSELYEELSQMLNSRLNVLNSRLDQLFRSGDSRP